MELTDYVRLLVRSWVLIVICSLLGLAVGGVYLLSQPVLYSASASTYVSTSSASDVSSGASGQDLSRGAAADLAEIANTPYVLTGVRRALQIRTSVATLSQQVQARTLPDSSIVEVSATATSPSLASALANAVIVELGPAVQRLTPNVGNAASILRTTTLRRSTPPASPSSPAVTFDLAVGLVAGFALGVVLVLLRQSIDQRVRSADQVARVSRGPIIGTVPVSPPTFEGTDVLAPGRIGAFRGVRSEILEGAAQNRVVVVSGSTRGESTATVAASIAATVANARLSTLLVDAVSTSAPAAPVFDSAAEPGLTEILDRSGALERLLVKGPVDGLWYLAPGRPSGQRDDLIASVEMTDVLEAVISRFNVILINTDPVEDSPIARTLGRQADGVVLVAELNRTTAPEVRRAAESLERGGARLIGTVLVAPDQRATRRHANGKSFQTRVVEA